MDIERLATTAVTERISFCEGISPFINAGDKEPSWDGNVYIYPNDIKRKAELIAKIPVQVKGSCEKSTKTINSINFDAEVADLINYANDGGVIYFVVIFGDDRKKQIFYRCLLPFDLHNILKFAGKSTKSINLKILPDDDKIIRQIFLSFNADKKRQATQIIWSKEQAIAAVRDGASFEFHIQPKDGVKNQLEIMRETTIQPFYMYVHTKDGVEFPFAKIEDEATKITKLKFDTPVFVNNAMFYNHFYLGYENGKGYIYIGNIRMPAAEDEKHPKLIEYTYTINGTLSERITDSDFLIALSQHKKIRIGNFLTHEVNMNNQEEVSRLHDLNADLKKIRTALEYFGVKDDLNMDILNDTDNQNINYLVQAAECNEIYFKEKELPNLFYSNTLIGNIIVRILAKKDNGNEDYRLCNAFIDEAHVKLKVTLKNGNKKIIEPWSLFLHMKADDFLCSNIDYDIILNSIKMMKLKDREVTINITENQYISATNMLLEIIRAYDSQSMKNKRLLQFSIDIADVLLTKKAVTIINKLQAIKRQRPLSNNEIASLVTLRNKKNQMKVINCAIAILLEERENAKGLLNELSEEERKSITDYPLYALLK